MFAITFVNRTDFFFREGVWCHGIFIYRRNVKKCNTHTSPGDPVQFNQSDDDFDTTELFPNKCTICIRHLANSPWAWHVWGWDYLEANGFRKTMSFTNEGVVGCQQFRLQMHSHAPAVGNWHLARLILGWGTAEGFTVPITTLWVSIFVPFHWVL